MIRKLRSFLGDPFSHRTRLPPISPKALDVSDSSAGFAEPLNKRPNDGPQVTEESERDTAPTAASPSVEPRDMAAGVGW